MKETPEIILDEIATYDPERINKQYGPDVREKALKSLESEVDGLVREIVTVKEREKIKMLRKNPRQERYEEIYEEICEKIYRPEGEQEMVEWKKRVLAQIEKTVNGVDVFDEGVIKLTWENLLGDPAKGYIDDLFSIRSTLLADFKEPEGEEDDEDADENLNEDEAFLSIRNNPAVDWDIVWQKPLFCI